MRTFFPARACIFCERHADAHLESQRHRSIGSNYVIDEEVAHGNTAARIAAVQAPKAAKENHRREEFV